MRVSKAVLLPLIIIVVLGLWLMQGSLVVSGQGDGSDEYEKPQDASQHANDASQHANDASQPINQESQQEASISDGGINGTDVQKKFVVLSQIIDQRMKVQHVKVKGRTRANKSVQVKAETNGEVIRRHVRKGDTVSKDEVLCSLDKGSREARVLEAEVQLDSAKSSFKAAEKLKDRNFGSKNQSRTKEAAFKSAEAAFNDAQLELERTEIKSPLEGSVEAPIAEVGDHLNIGSICATIVSLDPLLVVSDVSQTLISKIHVGQTARIILKNGEEIEAKVSYVATEASKSTRTFGVELEFANPDLIWRSGLTATGFIQLNETPAHLVPSSALLLNDAGQLGVKIVESGKAAFKPVELIENDGKNQWVSGLEGQMELIVLGHHYVLDGQEIESQSQKSNQEN